MNKRQIGSILIAGAAAVLLLTISIASAQDDAGGGKGKGRAVPSGPAPKLADGKPDFSGVWGPDRNFIYDINDALKPGESLPIQPWALKLTKERLSKDDPEANCLPTGVPRQAPYPWRILQTPTLVYFIFEGNIHSYRQIFLNMAKHSEDPNPTWYGESIAKYEGNTLTIDSIGFNDKFWFDFAGHPHTEKLHTIEHFRRPDLGHLEWDATIDDPGAYTKPFVMYGKSTLQTNNEIMEFICQENNKDVIHIVDKDPRNKYSKEK